MMVHHCFNRIVVRWPRLSIALFTMSSTARPLMRILTLKDSGPAGNNCVGGCETGICFTGMPGLPCQISGAAATALAFAIWVATTAVAGSVVLEPC